jgi:hypothetical protein
MPLAAEEHALREKLLIAGPQAFPKGHFWVHSVPGIGKMTDRLELVSGKTKAMVRSSTGESCVS